MRSDQPPLTFAEAMAMPWATAETPRAGRPDPFAAYRPWRKLKYVASEAGFDAVRVWAFLKQRRWAAWQPIGVPRSSGESFGFVRTRTIDEQLHVVDRAMGVDLATEVGSSRERSTLRKRLAALQSEGYLAARRKIANVMEEAAESSIMEGASTTRADAVRMLRAGRPPRTNGERMILNNYHAMQLTKESLERRLDVEFLIELQSVLTTGTLDQSDHSGRLRRDSDHVRVVDTRTGEVVFVPPRESELMPLLRAIVDFANTEHAGERFIHPIVKASILHFLIGYAHPFPDGNGRTARAIFYWQALRTGYSIFEYLSISEIIRKAYAAYPQAYIDSEVDDGDVTYFVEFQLDVIRRAIDRLAEHIAAEQKRFLRGEALLRVAPNLNVRQLLILDHAARHPTTQYTVKNHANSNGITLMTARTDLEGLVRRRLMTTTKRGREVIYHPSPSLPKKLDAKGT